MQESHGAGVTAVSKGVIQRDHQHTVTITGSNLYQPPNPFNLMPEGEVDSYASNVEKQSDSGKLNLLLRGHITMHSVKVRPIVADIVAWSVCMSV